GGHARRAHELGLVGAGGDVRPGRVVALGGRLAGPRPDRLARRRPRHGLPRPIRAASRPGRARRDRRLAAGPGDGQVGPGRRRRRHRGSRLRRRAHPGDRSAGGAQRLRRRTGRVRPRDRLRWQTVNPLPAALVTGPPLLAAIAAWSPLWLAAATLGGALLLAAAPPPRRLYAATAIGSGLVVFAINPFVSVQGLTVLWQGPHIPILDTQITVEEVAYGAGAGMRVAASALAVAAFVRLVDPDLLLRAFS